MPIPDALTIAKNIYAAGGGDNSRLQQPRHAYLGHPAYPGSDVRLPPDAREYAGQVWVHEGVGAYPQSDDDTSERDDAQPAVFTALLPPNVMGTGHARYGVPVLLQNINGRLTVVELGGVEASEYLDGVPDHETSAIGPELFAFGLLRATNPPSAAAELVGGIYKVDDDIYSPPTLVTGDLIATHTSGLTGSQAKVVQVRFDPSDGSFDYTSGSVFNDSWHDSATGINDHIGAFANYPATNTSTSLFNRGWIKFRAGMTEIKPTDILADPGFLQTGTGGGLAEGDLPSVSFANKFTAKLAAGAASSLPGSPAGVGDAYFATDTKLLYIANAAGTGWIGYDVGDTESGDKAYLLTTGGTMTGNITMGQNYLNFTELSGDPSAPTTNRWLLYAYDGTAYLKDDNGTTYDLTAGGSGGGAGSLEVCRVSGGSFSGNVFDDFEYQVTSFSEDWDSAGYFDSGTDDDQIVIPSSKGGIFRVGGFIQFDEPSGGFGYSDPAMMEARIKLNGTTILLRHNSRLGFDIESGENDWPWGFSFTDQFELEDGDELGLYFYARLGSTASWTVSAARMSIERLGDTPT